MKASSFYGAGRSRPGKRLLASAQDIVKSQESNDLEIVLLPQNRLIRELKVMRKVAITF